MEEVTVTAAIIAIVRAVKQVYPPLHGLLTIILAVVLGGVAGYLKVQGLDIVSGITVGLAAVGATTVADRMGNTSAVK